MSSKEIKIAIIGGSGIYNLDAFKKGKEIKIKTPFGFSFAREENRFVFLTRHGKGLQYAPHKINYKANIFALKKLGARYIFAFNSTGSLKKELKPGHFLIPSDYIDFNPPTFYEKNPQFFTPYISEKARQILIKILKKLKIKFWPKGIYYNTKGPRLETKAEINMIKNYADLVGMTMAKEATLSQELGLEYASVCSIDNYAHGLTIKPLTIKEIAETQAKNSLVVEKIIKEILNLKLE